MTSQDSGGWLKALLAYAIEARWCTRPFCTTCGCVKFRHAVWSEAARQAGVETARLKCSGHPIALLASLSDGEREATVRALVAGLRQLPPWWCDSQAYRTILIELDLMQDVPMNLDEELSGTPAGEALARKEAYEEEKWIRAERARREADENRQAVEERKRIKREEKARAYALHQARARERNAARMKLLAALARLSVVERLTRFATDPALNIDWVSAELIPRQEGELVDLDKATAVALIERIGRRKGEWRRLRRMLEHRLKAETE